MPFFEKTVPNDRFNQFSPEANDKNKPGMHEFLSQRYLHSGNKKRVYQVYLPSNYTGKRALPLVMVLHGCRQTHEDIAQISQFSRLAEKQGFIVVYPFVTHYNDMRTRNCWGWWRPEHVSSGQGEVEDLRCIINEVCQRYCVDAQRIHITGLSSGAGMTVAALTAHPGLFASGAAVAGLPYGERAEAVSTAFTSGTSFRPLEVVIKLMEKERQGDRTLTPLLVVHSHDDETVNIQAGCNLRDAWLEYFGVSGRHHRRRKRTTAGVPWVHTRYGRWWRKTQVETVFLQGPGHGWVGGAEGEFSYPSGPDVSALIWAFFRKHRRTSE